MKTDEQIIRRLVHGPFHNDFNSLRAIWRLASGNKEKAYATICALGPHYGIEPEAYHIDMALAKLNGGVEMEWES
jgi:hypothetical protein